jgi:hypothetical protein
MQEIDKLRSERNAVASAMNGKLDLAFREELIEQGSSLNLSTSRERERERSERECMCVVALTSRELKLYIMTGDGMY